MRNKGSASLDDLLWGRQALEARSNPSKAFLTVQAAVQESGGWYFKDVDGAKWYYVVLSGPYTGTFEMGPRTFLWHRGWKIPFAGGFKTQALRKTYEDRLWSKLGPLPQVFGVSSLVDEIPARERGAWFELAEMWRDSGLPLRDFLINVEGRRREEAKRARARLPSVRVRGTRIVKIPMKRINALALSRTLSLLQRLKLDELLVAILSDLRDQELHDEVGRKLKALESKLLFALKRPSDVPRVMSPGWVFAVADDDEVTSRAAMLSAYLLGQCAGLSPEAVSALLLASPGRKKLFFELSNDYRFGSGLIPSRMTERMRFARVLFQTWSIQRAQKALLSQVEGLLPHPVKRPEQARYALSGVPSWKGRLQTMELGVDELLIMAREVQRRGLRSAEFQMLWRHPSMTKNKLNMLMDVLAWLHRNHGGQPDYPALYGRLAESVPGRRALQAYEDRDFLTLFKYHDLIATLYEESQEQESDPKIAGAFHARASEFVCPPGVAPLRTLEEFKAEGKEMGHCVGGYFWQTRSFCFSFRAVDGTRATLELTRPRSVAQFYSLGNSNPSPACLALLDQFMQANKDRVVPEPVGAAEALPNWRRR